MAFKFQHRRPEYVRLPMDAPLTLNIGVSKKGYQLTSVNARGQIISYHLNNLYYDKRISGIKQQINFEIEHHVEFFENVPPKFKL